MFKFLNESTIKKLMEDREQMIKLTVYLAISIVAIGIFFTIYFSSNYAESIFKEGGVYREYMVNAMAIFFFLVFAFGVMVRLLSNHWSASALMFFCTFTTVFGATAFFQAGVQQSEQKLANYQANKARIDELTKLIDDATRAAAAADEKARYYLKKKWNDYSERYAREAAGYRQQAAEYGREKSQLLGKSEDVVEKGDVSEGAFYDQIAGSMVGRFLGLDKGAVYLFKNLSLSIFLDLVLFLCLTFIILVFTINASLPHSEKIFFAGALDQDHKPSIGGGSKSGYQESYNYNVAPIIEVVEIEKKVKGKLSIEELNQIRNSIKNRRHRKVVEMALEDRTTKEIAAATGYDASSIRRIKAQYLGDQAPE